MNGLSLLPVFMIGLLGSVHCVGMCGGIVGAFSAAASAPNFASKKFPIAVVATRSVNATISANAITATARVLSYNLGRIASYALAGAMAGGIVNGINRGINSGTRALTGTSTLQVGGYWLANLMLIALGLYLMDAWRGLAQLERIGQALWRHLQPLTRHLMPLDSRFKLFALGGLWGWLPCGMVYSMLLTAMLSGSAVSGATVMLVFGLGTLPTLLAMGLLGAQLRAWMQRRSVRVASGVIVLSFGVLGLLRVADGLPMSWLDSFCVTPISL